MKVTALDLVTAQQGMGELMAVKLPVGVSFRLARLARVIGDEVKLIYSERDKLIRKYGATDEKGNASIKPESANWSAYTTDVNALFAQELPIDVEPVELPATVELSGGALLALYKFITIA